MNICSRPECQTTAGCRCQAPSAVPPLPQGWLCPKCGSAHGPAVQTCPSGNVLGAWPGRAYPPATSFTARYDPNVTVWNGFGRPMKITGDSDGLVWRNPCPDAAPPAIGNCRTLTIRSH